MSADLTAPVGMTHGEALGLAETWAARDVPAFVLEIVWNVDKSKTDKIPLTAHGHLDATTDVRQLRHMFNSATPRRGGVLGVGLHPGPAGYLAVDVDEDDNLTRYDERDLCATYTVTTARGNGRHYWYRKREPVRVGIACEWPEVDVVRSDDGFVVAPGTATPWGTWQAFDEFPDDVADCPAELWVALTRDGPGSNGSSPVAGRGYEAVVAKLREAGRDQDAVALTVLCEQHGGHHPFIRNDGAVFVTRPDKSAGTSASVGYVAPGVVKVFTTGWPGLTACGTARTASPTGSGEGLTDDDDPTGLRGRTRSCELRPLRRRDGRGVRRIGRRATRDKPGLLPRRRGAVPSARLRFAR